MQLPETVNKLQSFFLANGSKLHGMKKWEYRLLVELWDRQRQCFYWADNETDLRSAKQRLDALEQEGWEVLSSLPRGAHVTQHNYLLRRPVVETMN